MSNTFKILGVLVLLVLISSVYAIGFHPPAEVSSGEFNGDYIFNGSVNFSDADIDGLHGTGGKWNNNTKGIDYRNGNIGINTNDPRYHLSIGSNKTGVNGGGHIVLYANDTEFLRGDGNNNQLELVRDGGNVGIGTSSPDAALDVASGNVDMNRNNIENLPKPPLNDTSTPEVPITKDFFRAFGGWGANPANDEMDLYHVAVHIPGGRSDGTPKKAVPICAPMTDDNEPFPYSTSSSWENNLIIGYSTDYNGNCFSDNGNWSSRGPCVSLLVAGWEAESHEGFGAWCRDGSGGITQAQVNFAGGAYYDSTGTNSGGISKPALGETSCSNNGDGCVKRIR